MPTYYTPTVEDLVFGLEFERPSYITGDYIKDRIDNAWIIESMISFGLPHLRIKHLDEDDIIELGWTLTYKQKPPFENKEFLLGEDYKLFITDWDDVTICSIEHKGMEDEYLDTMFSGKLPNKAELERLMNNLSITK